MNVRNNPKGNSVRLNFWFGVVGLVGLLALGLTIIVGVWKIIEQFIAFLKTIDAQIAAQIIGTSGTVLAAVVAVVLGQVYTKHRDLREAHRKVKTDIYNAFVQKITDVLFTGEKKPEEELQNNLITFFREFSTKLMLSGSDRVIKAFNAWREAGHTNSAIILSTDRLLCELRRDLGHKNRGLKPGDVIKLYLKPGEYEKTPKTEQ